MKTAISIPDEVYSSAEKLADRLGKSRSQLYTQAISNYIAKHHNKAITAKLNTVYLKQESKVDRTLIKLQVKSLPKEGW